MPLPNMVDLDINGPPAFVQRLQRLIGAESDAEDQIQIVETHKSWVFLAPDNVYKLKKQIRDDLQDLTALRARHDNTLTEIDLNRRLAADIYVGADKVVIPAYGQLALNGTGQVIDWLVKMKRLPASLMLDAIITKNARDDTALSPFIESLAGELVAFYRKAPVSNLTADELLTIHQEQASGRTILLHPRFNDHHDRFRAVLAAREASFADYRVLFSKRVAAGRIVEGHGDLRPEHICLMDPPQVFDCLEFNRNLRMIDPLSEIAFLGMECAVLGAPWIKQALLRDVLTQLGDVSDDDLLRHYTANHALLRARLSLAHLLVSNPRTPQKWLPLALHYISVAEEMLCLDQTTAG